MGSILCFEFEFPVYGQFKLICLVFSFVVDDNIWLCSLIVSTRLVLSVQWIWWFFILVWVNGDWYFLFAVFFVFLIVGFWFIVSQFVVLRVCVNTFLLMGFMSTFSSDQVIKLGMSWKNRVKFLVCVMVGIESTGSISLGRDHRLCSLLLSYFECLVDGMHFYLTCLCCLSHCWNMVYFFCYICKGMELLQ